MQFSRDYLLTVCQAVFVTILWSSSWVIIKFGLEEVPPLIFAGLRYVIGSSTLFLVMIFSNRTQYIKDIKGKSKQWWLSLALYGFVFIALTQGGQYLALSLLPAITVSFVLNLTPFMVIVISYFLLREKSSFYEIIFFIIMFGGLLIYFFPLDLDIITPLGLFVLTILIISNSFSSIIGRAINRRKDVSPIIITTFSMAIGSMLLLIFSFILEDLEIIKSLSPLSIIYIIWLGVVNTAFAFTLWNKAMQLLRAMDITIINSLMLPQIVLLSLIFLGEFPLLKEWIGLILIVISTFGVQLIQAQKNSTS